MQIGDPRGTSILLSGMPFVFNPYADVAIWRLVQAGGFFLVGAVGVTAWADEGPSSRCVVLTSTVTGLPDFDDIVEVELRARRIHLVGAADGTSCIRAQVESIAPDVAVVQVAAQQARVIELAPVDEHLRARSVALALAEALRSEFGEPPQLQDAPDPTQVTAPTEPAATHLAQPQTFEATQPPRDANRSERSTGLLWMGAVDHALETSHTFGTVAPTLDLDLGLADLGRLRLGTFVSFGSKDTAFGDLDAWLFGIWAGWSWTPLRGSAAALHIVPEASVGVAWVRAFANESALVNSGTAVKTFFRFGLGAYLEIPIAGQVSAEFGPVVQFTPDPPQALGDGSAVGGLGVVSLGGRAAVRVEL